MLSGSLMGDPVMLLLSGMLMLLVMVRQRPLGLFMLRMDPCNSGIGDRGVPVVLCLVRT